MISYIRSNFIILKLCGFFILNILLCLQIFILIINYNDQTNINYFTNIVSCMYICITYLIFLFSIKYQNNNPPDILIVAFSSCSICLYFVSLATFIVNIKDNYMPPNTSLQWISTVWVFILSVMLGIAFKLHKKIILFFRRMTDRHNLSVSENNNHVVVNQQNQTNILDDIIFIIVDVNKIDSSNENCSICMLSLRSNIPVKTSCNHIFHNECIMKNINVYKNNKCPLCRTEICVL